MIRTGHPEVDRALAELYRQMDLARSPIGRGQQLDGISLTTTAKAIPHRLGRKALGYLVVGSTVATTFADENAGKADLDKFIYIKAGVNTTASLWVY